MTHFLRPGVPWDSPAKFLGEQLGASPPANESAFWNHWETAVLGQILARSHLEKYSGNLAPFNQLLKLPSGIIGNGPLWAKSRREAFLEPNVRHLTLSRKLLKFASGNLGTGPFWAKSWPGAFLEPEFGYSGHLVPP